MKLYVVEYSSGQYEDYEWHIEGIFTDAWKAEECAAKIRADIERIRAEENPIGHDDWAIMTEEEYTMFSEWQKFQYNAHDFNSVIVNEFESDVELSEYKN